MKNEVRIDRLGPLYTTTTSTTITFSIGIGRPNNVSEESSVFHTDCMFVLLCCFLLSSMMYDGDLSVLICIINPVFSDPDGPIMLI